MKAGLFLICVVFAALGMTYISLFGKNAAVVPPVPAETLVSVTPEQKAKTKEKVRSPDDGPHIQFSGEGRTPLGDLGPGEAPLEEKARWRVSTADRDIVELVLTRIEKNPKKGFIDAKHQGSIAEQRESIAKVRAAGSWALLVNHDSITVFNDTGRPGFVGIMKDGMEKSSETRPLWELVEKAEPANTEASAMRNQKRKREDVVPRPKIELILPDPDDAVKPGENK